MVGSEVSGAQAVDQSARQLAAESGQVRIAYDDDAHLLFGERR
jgi:hypothetical protein